MIADCVKAIRVRSALKRLKRAKLNGYRQSIGLPEVHDWSLLNIPILGCKILFKRVCCCFLQWKVRGTNYTALDYLFLSGTLPNKIFKSIIGFLCGIACIFLLKVILTNSLNVKSSKTSWSCSLVVGFVLAFGLAFSQTIRFICLLTVPQIFTRQIRVVLIGYALSLAMSGPGLNYVHNLETLSKIIHCCIHMFDEAFKDLTDIIRKPRAVIAKFFKSLKDDIQLIFEEFTAMFQFVKDAMNSVVNTIKSAYRWLKGITEVCNDEYGRPYNRCKMAFKEASLDCQEKLGDSMSFMCHVDALDDLCELTKVADILCVLPALIKENIFEPIEREMNKILDSLKEFFDARIHLRYNLDIDLNTSKSIKTIFTGMRNEIFADLHWLLDYSNSVDVILAAGFFVVAILSTLNYRYWYLNSDRHDNKYITRGMVKMDMERMKLGREGIFPLKFNESKLYVQVKSLAMLKSENKKFKRDLLLVFLSIVPILAYIFLDLSLYLLLVLFQEHGQIHLDLKGTLDFVNITGEGFMADIDRAIVKALKPLQEGLPNFNTTKCIMEPKAPNYAMYTLITFLLLLSFILVCTEAYGLRLRHLICGIYYPDRQLYRDRWLYTHIITTRGSFFKYARTQIIAKLTGDTKTYRISLRQRLIHSCPGGRKLFWFLETTQKNCFLCGRNGDLDDLVNFHHCPTCNSVYCADCFQQVQKKCPVCFKTMDFGEQSLDEEIGSDSISESESFSEYPGDQKLLLKKNQNLVLKRKRVHTPKSDEKTSNSFLKVHKNKNPSKIKSTSNKRKQKRSKRSKQKALKTSPHSPNRNYLSSDSNSSHRSETRKEKNRSILSNSKRLRGGYSEPSPFTVNSMDLEFTTGNSDSDTEHEERETKLMKFPELILPERLRRASSAPRLQNFQIQEDLGMENDSEASLSHDSFWVKNYDDLTNEQSQKDLDEIHLYLRETSRSTEDFSKSTDDKRP